MNMKKFALLLAVTLCAALLPSGAVAEDSSFSIAEKIRSFMLVNHPQTLEILTEINRQYVMDATLTNIEFDKHGYDKPTDPEEVQRQFERNMIFMGLIPENSFAFYMPVNLLLRYTKQYADSANFEEFLQQDMLWLVAGSNEVYYAKDLSLATYTAIMGKDANNTGASYQMSDNEMIQFLQNPEAIEDMAKQEIREPIIDCKIVSLGAMTVLYLKSATTDYGIKIYARSAFQELETNFEMFKIYPVADMLDSYAHHRRIPITEALDVKPTYEAEGEALMAEGLIQGTEKGYDPLKPLNRIEATTILVRALGLENEPVSETPEFNDIEAGSWGVRYANIAKAKGLSNGVGDGKFAPDDLVSSDQFATLLLRSKGEEFSWEQATELLIERGIITAEQAETMDLFTRGDMAKIIYEAKQKGLLG
jgi:hypothetical protein